ncbi:helix-turn-helix transcriptional regulator [Faecalicoccus pleomorphus]|nr:helix-turn-helix transcriptional regulator [Faecalicoccus pleomorphus]
MACLIMRNIFIIISGVEVMGYLLEIMQEKNISLQYLSSRLNVSVQLLKYWIDKDYSIRVNQAIQLSSTLDVSINRLFLGTEKPSLNISKLNFEQIQIIYDILDPNHRKQKRHTPNKALEDIKDMGDKIKFIRKDILNLSQNKLAKSFNVCYKNKSLLVIKFDIKLFLAPSFIKKENKRQSLKLSLD